MLNYAILLLIRLGNLQSAESEELAWVKDEMFLHQDSMISCDLVVRWRLDSYSEPLGDFLSQSFYTSFNKVFLVLICVYILIFVSFGFVVNQLKSLLLKQGREITTTLSPSKKQPPPKVE